MTRPIAEIKAALDLVDLVARVVALKPKGRDHWGLCPMHGEKTPSFKVDRVWQTFHCFGCGAHGDAIDWIVWRDRVSKAEAIRIAAAEAGLEGSADGLRGGGASAARAREAAERRKRDQAAAEAERRRRAKHQRQRDIDAWRAAAPAIGSPVETYLRARGLTIEPPPTLRFVRAPFYADGLEPGAGPRKLGVWPAMIAAVQAPDRSLLCLHRTYLSDDYSAKREIVDPATGEILPSKKVTGSFMGGAIRLAPGAPRIAVAEGIETALSVMQSTGLPTWCAVSLGNMAGPEGGRRVVHPEDKGRPRAERRFLPSTEPDMTRPAFEPPRDCFEILFLADADGSDLDVMRRHMRRAVARQAARGVAASVAWPRPGCDFNDLLREGTQDAA